MKKVLILLLLFCNSLFSQTPSNYQFSGNQLESFKSYDHQLKFRNNSNNLDFIGSDSIMLTGEAAGNQFGYTVSSAGDVNGDGYSDIVVGANYYSGFRGRAYIFLGGNPSDNIADIILSGELPNNEFGCSVSTAGDVNNDGFADVIVGAQGFSNSIQGASRGRAYIFFGGLIMDDIPDIILTGESDFSLFGCSVSTAGDVNNDGYEDVMVGANANSSNKGRAYIYLGGIEMDNSADVVMIGESSDNYFGTSVSFAGDVNSDGYSDVIIGAYGYNLNTGRAYIFYGSSSMNNIADVTFTGDSVDNYLGFSVSGAGNVNSDVYSDVIIGVPYGINFNKGGAFIYFGGLSMNNIADVVIQAGDSDFGFGYSVSTAGDINQDGFNDVIIGSSVYNQIYGRAYIFYGGSSMNNVSDITFMGETTSRNFGQSVSCAGDFNGDEYPDVIIGAYGYNSRKGKAYIYINLMPKPELIQPLNNSINNSLIIDLKWKRIKQNLYYILNVSTDSAFNNNIISDSITSDTSKILTGLQKESKYYWRIKAIDSSNNSFTSSVWNFTTIPPISINIKILFEGMYSPSFNQLIRKDSVTVYLHLSNPPFNILDSAKSNIDSLSFSGLFKFYNTPNGSYFISVRHLNSLYTWSKSGGETLANDGTIYNYDFTNSNTQAYGNNLKLKGSKYCLYSGDINQDGYITLFDVIPIYNDASSFITGRFIKTDLTGDGLVDLTDVTLCYNNSASFIGIIRP